MEKEIKKTVLVNKAKVIQDIREAIEELKLVKAGKLTARNAEDLISEL